MIFVSMDSESIWPKRNKQILVKLSFLKSTLIEDLIFQVEKESVNGSSCLLIEFWTHLSLTK